jgi:cyanobactin maturation PatA/PatG family protease
MVVSGIRKVWARTLGDHNVTIAVIDGPADLRHPCFAGASLEQIPADGSASCAVAGPESCSHGTHVASIIFAQHGKVNGLLGIAPRCRGVLIPLFRDDPNLRGRVLPASQSDLARAIYLALRHGAHIINVSGGQLSHRGQADPPLAEAVRRCVEQGVLVVAAAGNDGCDCSHVPAMLPGVLAVGALSGDGSPSVFSNYGQAYQRNGLLAPGYRVPGATPGGGVAHRSGTSFATPIVTGVAALLLSLKLRSPAAPVVFGKVSSPHGVSQTSRDRRIAAVREVRKTLVSSAEPCRLRNPLACRRFLGGALDVRKAFHLTAYGETGYGETTMNERVAEVPVPDGALDALSGHAGPDRAEVALSSCSCEAAPRTNQAETPDQRQPEEDEEEISPKVTSRPGLERGAIVYRSVSPSSARTRLRPSSQTASVRPSCECEGAGPLVYALGEIGYDFGTLARQDSIVFEMDEGTSPSNPAQFTAFLKKNPHFAPSVIWTLNLDGTPIYAIKPDGTFSRESYARIVEFYVDQIEEKSERAAIPGTIKGEVTLYCSGQVVPVICPEYRGMTNWNTAALRDAVGEAFRRARGLAAQPKDAGKGKTPVGGKSGGEDDEAFLQLENFLNRIYFELRNMGAAPEERALNYAATNAFVPGTVVERVAKLHLLLDEIQVVQSPICRRDSDCWDVQLYFFNSKDVLAARLVSRFTVDVSDVVPVIVGTVREWNVR